MARAAISRNGYVPSVSAGAFTVVMWASLPLLRQFTALPPMLTAAVAMAAAATVAAAADLLGSAVFVAQSRSRRAAAAGPASNPESGSDNSARLRIPNDPWYWFGGVGGLVGALFFYFAALPMGDPARITLVTYVWPIGFIVAASRLEAKAVPLQVFVGAAIAFVGVVPLVLAGSQGSGTPPAGYAIGIAAGGAWIAFSLFLRYAGRLSFAGYARLFAHAGATGLLFHLVFEGAVEADAADWITAAAIGIGPYGVAFMSWGFALRTGPTGLLGILNYSVPVIAFSLLVFFGYSKPEPALALATIAVVCGSMLASMQSLPGLRRLRSRRGVLRWRSKPRTSRNPPSFELR